MVCSVTSHQQVILLKERSGHSYLLDCPDSITYGSVNLLLQWAKSGSHRVFLDSLKQVYFEKEYTPDKHGYGLKRKKTPVPCQR
jgi:hypothetical protein